MKKKLMGLGILTALLVMVLTGCQNAENVTEPTREITDAAGRKVTIPKTVETVVPVGANAIRYVVYDGGVDMIVGVEEGDTKAPATKAVSYAYQKQFKNLPIISSGGSGGTTVNEEALIEVNPDVVLTTNDGETADTLQQKTGIPVVCLTLTDDVFDGDVYKNLELTGEVLGKQERSQEVIDYIQSVCNDLKARTENTDKDITAYSGAVSFKGAHGIEGTEAGYPPFAQIGIKNVVDETGKTGAFDIDVEQLLNWNPDYLFFDVENFERVKEDYQTRPEFYNQLDAVKNGQMYSQVAYRFNGTNTELAMANAYYVGKVVFPEAFADVDIAEKVDEITEKMLGVPYYDTLEKAGLSFKQLTFED